MKPHLLLLPAAAAVFIALGFSSGSKETVSTYKNTLKTPEENYANYCSGCHGEKMDAFTDRQWKHGSEVKDLMVSIKRGWKDEGMPAFNKTFTDKEIEELAKYIKKGIQNVATFNFDSEPVTGIFKSESITVKLDTIATGIDVAWGMAFLPDGSLLATERGGKMYKILNKKKQEITGVPEVLAEGQGGLFDIVLSPDFKTDNLIYFSYSKPKKENGKTLATTAVMCAKLDGNKLIDQKIIFEALPYAPTRHHYGSRLVFDDKGYLFISVGERGNEQQNPQSLDNNQLGKIHRIHADGTIPADNPFKDKEGKPTSIYCYGNRNPQSLAINPWSNVLWETEHGPRGGDEINIIQPGNNYGWPVTSYGINYNGTTITDKAAAPGITDPILYWIPSIAPSGMAFITGDVYKPWKGALVVGSLRFKYLNLCYLNGDKIVKEEKLLKNIGRLRDVRQGPDGFIYVAVEKPASAIYRLIPM
ncbi:PQQ-dependent sugar dehydrogenase [Flavobacterium sp. RHBU_3]|uniref:PQQ-dependent sugar dehydrogenase n=1 Tax=Flavobacterium sp. RHBU_3 TaxID=3391184 RepID=UPI003984B942